MAATPYHPPVYGTTAYHPTTYYGGTYATYHPPTTVNYNGSSCYDCGGWAVAGAAVAGVAVGAAVASANTAAATSSAYAAGVATGSATTAAATSSAYAAGYAAGSVTPTTYVTGAIYATLPPGCSSVSVQNKNYYLHGTTWFLASFGANGVYYKVVPAP